MIPTNPELRQFINQFFNDDELETMCFDYFPEALNDFSGGMSKNRKVIVLIGHCERRGRLDDLRAAVARERAEPWNRTFAPQPVETPRRDVSPSTVERDPRQIFLSHSTADAEFAHTLAADLRAEGWRVWIAPDSIRPGEKWVEAINRGLETSGVFVVVLTPAAVASRWVKSETNAAIMLEHNNRIRFLPLEVMECDIPLLWSGYQYVTFRYSYELGLDQLLRWLTGESTGSSSASDNEAYVQWLKSLPDKMYPPTVFLGPPPKPEIRINIKTGIELIRIPAGPFLYGSPDADRMAQFDEKPQRTINLREYWIGRFPVTNAQYKRFLDANPTRRVPHVDADWAEAYNWDQKSRVYPAGKANHPVVQISWADAKAFCDWAGLSLPTEEQWEKAARGADGRIWPWGNDAPTVENCNFNEHVGGTTPVRQYSPHGHSPFGCVDMAGNVWEWTVTEVEGTSWRVSRGGSFTNKAEHCRCALRHRVGPGDWLGNHGFRVLVAPS